MKHHTRNRNMKTTSCAVYLTISLILALLLDQCQGQNYHFSNGWQPGKRSQDGICQFRTDVKAVIFKLIEDEVLRMLADPSCYGGIGVFKHYLKKDLGYALDKK